MTNAPQLPAMYFTLDPETENQILLEVVQEKVEQLYADFDEKFPDLIIPPGVKQPKREMYERFLMRIVEAYPDNPEARMMELFWLLSEDYLDLYSQGVLPVPLSRPWNVLVRVPRVFARLQRIFIETYRRYVREENGRQ